jgi:pimeloyl-ACP methyl ester carboxylesterase
VQAPAEVEVIHQMILAARAGDLPIPGSRAFDKIIYVGHSYGSLIGNALNTLYPSDANATVLTGYSSQLVAVVPSVFVEAVPLPADTLQPSRFGNLPVGYLEVSSESGDRSLFFAGGYDPALFSYDFSIRGTVSLGEAVTIASSIQIATKYTNPVFVVTGQDDAIFCNLLGLDILLNTGCGSGSSSFLAQTSALYPNAVNYEWYAVPNSGHCWQLHYAAQAAFGTVHTWMANNGF